MFLSLFQTASGAWHLPSILFASSWFLGFMVTGFFLFFQLAAHRNERMESFKKERSQIAELASAKAKINELEDKIKPKPIKERIINLSYNLQCNWPPNSLTRFLVADEKFYQKFRSR